MPPARPCHCSTGANSTAEAVELSESAKHSGAQFSLSVVPYYKQAHAGRHVPAFSRHRRSRGFAHDPVQRSGRTVADLQNDTVLRLAQVTNIVGIKDATASLERGSDLLRRAPQGFAVYSGEDATGLPLMLMGGQG